MAEFAPGLIQGGEALSRDRYRQAQLEEAMRMMAMRQMVFQQEQQARQKAQQGREAGVLNYPGLGGPPPQQPPVQSMPPGQASQPMQPPAGPPPGTGAFGPPGGQPSPMLQGNAPAPMLTQPPTAPAGWKPSAAASPSLGGPGMPSGPPPGAAPQPQGQPGIMQPSGDWVASTIKTMQSAGKQPGEIADALDQIKVWHDQTSRQQYQEAQLMLRSQQVGLEAQNAELARLRAVETEREHRAQDTARDTRLAQGQQRINITVGGGGQQPGFSPDAVELGARMYLQTGQLPSMGMGKDAVRVRGQIMQRAAELQKEGGGELGDVATNVAGYKADVSSLRQLTQRSNAIEASAKKIDKDMKTLDKYLESGTAGSVTLVNRPLNVLRTEFSDPKLNELAVAAKIVGTEYERMITGGLLSVAQLHEGAREDADKLLNLNMTPDQMRATIKIMKQEIQNQRSSWKDQIDEVKKGMKKGGSSGEPATGKVVNWNDLK